VQDVLEGTEVTRNRKAKLASKKIAEQLTSSHAKARRLEQQRFDEQRLFAATTPEDKASKRPDELLDDIIQYPSRADIWTPQP
jgi:hypothetical protein